MYYYSLDKIVCPSTYKFLVCESFETEPVSNNSYEIQKCKSYCGYKGINPRDINSDDCNECHKLRVKSGKLFTEDKLHQYPIINGIPRFLSGSSKQLLYENYKDYFNKYWGYFETKDTENSEITKFDSMQLKTQKSFSNEWETFNSIHPNYKHLFDEYFRSVNLKELDGKDVLDAGCGMGRWAYFIAQEGANVYAIDFSSAVEEAYKNLNNFCNAHVIQADIYKLPFQEDNFDLVYSLGVLHHLPNPFEGFENVVKKAKKKTGNILVYLYYALDNKPYIWRLILSVVTQIRKISVKLPKGLLYPVCLIMSIFFKVLFAIPANILSRLRLKKASSYVPLNYYKDKSFKILYNDTVDRFSAPTENRYTRVQITEWFKKVGIDKCIIPESRPYWCATGTRNDE